MNILIINGSPRANGATGEILTEIKSILLKSNKEINVEYFDLGNMNLQFCKGCLACYKTGRCHIKDDDLTDLEQKLEKCDGVVFGSPTYASNVSGQFKILIDTIQFVFYQLLYNKACFSVVTYENADGKNVQKIISKLIHLSGGAVSSQYLLKLNHGDKAINLENKNQLLKLCQKFIIKAEKKNPLNIFEIISRYLVFNVGLKPHALKNESRYKGTIDRWIRQGLITERGK